MAGCGTDALCAVDGLLLANHLGKTSHLQFLLMLEQTVESTDYAQVLNLGP